MAVQGKPGIGEAVVVSFAVPFHSMEYWNRHFTEQNIDFDMPKERFGKQTIKFKDPDRLQLELVFDPEVNDIPAWPDGTVPEEYGIRGFWGTTLHLAQTEATVKILKNIFGFEKKQTEGNATLFRTGSAIGNAIILEKVEPKMGTNGRGIVHHVAFRAKDVEEQKLMRQQVIELGLTPTEIIDRHFFHSVYFRSPGGVLFEIATDEPGYRSVQEEHEMGKKLYLPDWLEPRREEIEKKLPKVEI